MPFHLISRVRAAAPAALLLLACAAPVSAADWTSFSASYGVTLAGLPIGKVNLDATLNDDAYRLAGGGKVSGVAQIVSQGKGRVSSVGRFSEWRPVPSRYDYSETSGGETLAIGMALKGGNVTSASVNPPLDRMNERVPVTKAHKRGVLDPLSMLVMPVQNVDAALSGGACKRTLPIYDGRARFDLKLSYLKTETVSTDGYDGPAVVCRVAFKPVSGHRKGRREIGEAESRSDIRLWLAPVGDNKVLAAYKLTAKTRVGTAVVEARRFSAKPM